MADFDPGNTTKYGDISQAELIRKSGGTLSVGTQVEPTSGKVKYDPSNIVKQGLQTTTSLAALSQGALLYSAALPPTVEAVRSALAVHFKANPTPTPPQVLPVAPSAPTIAVTTTATGTGTLASHRFTNNDTNLVVKGGGPITGLGLGPSPDSARRRFPVGHQNATTGDYGPPFEIGGTWRVGIRTNSAVILARVTAASTYKYRWLVDGQYVDKAGTVVNPGGGSAQISLTFPGQAYRNIELEGYNGTGTEGFWTDADAVNAPLPTTNNFRVGLFTDSFGRGQNTVTPGDGVGPVLGDLLKVRDFISSGVSGTGWADKGVGAAFYNALERISDSVFSGLLNVEIYAYGVNDRPNPQLVAANVAPALIAANAANPNALRFVLSPWDNAAPAAPAADYLAVKAAILSGIAASGVNCIFIDVQGVAYTQADGIHPNNAGAVTLATFINDAIRNYVLSFYP